MSLRLGEYRRLRIFEHHPDLNRGVSGSLGLTADDQRGVLRNLDRDRENGLAEVEVMNARVTVDSLDLEPVSVVVTGRDAPDAVNVVGVDERDSVGYLRLSVSGTGS